jgi:murein DD-endopeptidase MepM/ murein hydrolase activator NlpD
MKARSFVSRLLLPVCFMIEAALILQGCASGRRAVEPSVMPRGWPVPYDIAQVSSPFGAQRGSSRHQGLDLSAPKGTPVRATADGRVIFAGRAGDFGRLVVIDHGNGYETRYAHLKSIDVGKGAKITRGKVIGRVGKSGNATGYHLHYEIRLQGTPVNPRSFL